MAHHFWSGGILELSYVGRYQQCREQSLHDQMEIERLNYLDGCLNLAVIKVGPSSLQIIGSVLSPTSKRYSLM